MSKHPPLSYYTLLYAPQISFDFSQKPAILTYPKFSKNHVPPDEIKEVQDGIDEVFGMISNREPLSPERKTEFQAVFERDQLTLKPGHQFAAMIGIGNPALYRRLLADPRVGKFAHLAFMPETTGLVYDSPYEPVIDGMVSTRDAVFRFKHHSIKWH